MPTPIVHTRAAIISVGDELVLGQSLDTNSQWLSDRLVSLGVPVVEHVTIADDLREHVRAFERLAGRADLVVCTGGLGPTDDDLTRAALAEVLRERRIVDEAELVHLTQLFAARGRRLNEGNRGQATRPASARCLRNPLGTAPGLHATLTAAPAQADIVCLPGPPAELRPMFETHVVPLLNPPPGRVVRTRLIRVVGLGESDAAARVADLMRRDRNPLVGITASGGRLTWRLRCHSAQGPEHADALLDETEAIIRAAMGPLALPGSAASLEHAVVEALSSRSRTLGVVESCTAGMLGEALTRVPGASRAFHAGLITYTNTAKAALAGVDPSLIDTHGAVSSPVAQAMALGGLDRLGVDACVAITGIAGPEGGTPDNPVGTVWIALAQRGTSQDPAEPVEPDVRRFWIPGDRDDIRDRAVTSALGMLYLALTAGSGFQGRLLFQRA